MFGILNVILMYLDADLCSQTHRPRAYALHRIECHNGREPSSGPTIAPATKTATVTVTMIEGNPQRGPGALGGIRRTRFTTSSTVTPTPGPTNPLFSPHTAMSDAELFAHCGLQLTDMRCAYVTFGDAHLN